MYYPHICRIERITEKVSEWGLSETGWEIVHDSIKCHLSQKNLKPSDTNVITSSKQDYKLFLTLDHAIYQGDKITVLDADFTRSFLSSEPIRYKLLKKQEIILQEVSE